MQIRASIWGACFFDSAFLLLTTLGERRLLHWGFSLAGLNRFCNPTTALLIISTILVFIFILILSILSHHPHHPHHISSSSTSSSSSSSSTHSCYHHFRHHQFPSSFWSETSSTSKDWHCLWLAATPKYRVRPYFTLLIPLYDYHPTPALLAFVPPPWPQVFCALSCFISLWPLGFCGFVASWLLWLLVSWFCGFLASLTACLVLWFLGFFGFCGFRNIDGFSFLLTFVGSSEGFKL